MEGFNNSAWRKRYGNCKSLEEIISSSRTTRNAGTPTGKRNRKIHKTRIGNIDSYQLASACKRSMSTIYTMLQSHTADDLITRYADIN